MAFAAGIELRSTDPVIAVNLLADACFNDRALYSGH